MSLRAHSGKRNEASYLNRKNLILTVLTGIGEVKSLTFGRWRWHLQEAASACGKGAAKGGPGPERAQELGGGALRGGAALTEAEAAAQGGPPNPKELCWVRVTDWVEE